MALIHCDCYSRTLEMAISFCAIVPEYSGPSRRLRSRAAKPAYRVLYLLHGLSDDHTTWQRRTSIERLPRLYQCCGTGGSLLADNRHFLKLARSLDVSVTYEEGPGQHEWGYWDRQIQKALAWMMGG